MTLHSRRSLAILGQSCLLLMLLACAPGEPESAGDESTSALEAATGAWFEDVSIEAGIQFRHDHGGSGQRYMVETMGSGGGVIDFDGDGWLDIVLLQGQPLPGHPEHDPVGSSHPWAHALYRNRGNGRFEDVSKGAGLESIGYGMGLCAGDIDNDGRTDLYVTAFGPDRLLRNEGNGRFVDITEAAGIDNPAWGASCAMADYDRDGCLDIYVTNYVDSRLDNHVRCGPATNSQYCHPDVYSGVPDLLHRNRCEGSGQFDEVGEQAGIRISDPNEAKGLGVVWFDHDDDGYPDIYVANDSTRNFLFRNRGDGTFEEVGVIAGVAYNADGRTEAGMGIAVGDFAASGQFDLVVTHLDFETNTYYRNLGQGLFEDATIATGIGPPSMTRVGFGISAVDADNDGHLDLYVANGHILDNIAALNSTLAHAQPDQLLHNHRRGGFQVVAPAQAGPWFATPMVGRGAMAADLDNDGSMDLLLSNNHGTAHLLRNQVGQRGHWLKLRLVSRYGERDAIGARVRLHAGGRVQQLEARAGSSYLVSEDPRLHFGLGDLQGIERLEIRWPEGDIQIVEGKLIPINQLTVIRQDASGTSAQ